MVDVSETTFEYPGDETLTVYHDQYDGYGLIGRTRGGRGAVSLAEGGRLSAIFFDLDENRVRLFLGNCRLEVDFSSVIDRQITYPVGSLLVGRVGTAVRVQGARGSALLSLFGEPVTDVYDGFAFSRWSLIHNRVSGEPVTLFQHDAMSAAEIK